MPLDSTLLVESPEPCSKTSVTLPRMYSASCACNTDHWAQHLNKTSWDLQRSQCDNIILQTDLDGREDISKENQSNDSPHNTLHLLAQQLGIVHNLVFRVQGGGGGGEGRGERGGREGGGRGGGGALSSG